MIEILKIKTLFYPFVQSGCGLFLLHREIYIFLPDAWIINHKSHAGNSQVSHKPVISTSASVHAIFQTTTSLSQ
jgi:hypothetical protein